MKKRIVIGVVVLLVGVLTPQAWAHGMGGVGRFHGGFQGGGGGFHGHFGGFHEGFTHPGFHGGFGPPGFQGGGHFQHFQHEQLFGPHHHLGGFFFDAPFFPDGLQVVVISAPVSGIPSKQQCGPEAHWDATLRRCRQHTPLASSPPPGVIVLRPGGRREPAETCPEGFIEQIAKGWRFCLDPQHLEPVSPLMAPPIAGIPYAEALKIMQRHREELVTLPGVKAVGLGRKGLYVEADNPAVLPAKVEGLPLEVHPWRPRKRE